MPQVFIDDVPDPAFLVGRTKLSIAQSPLMTKSGHARRTLGGTTKARRCGKLLNKYPFLRQDHDSSIKSLRKDF